MSWQARQPGKGDQDGTRDRFMATANERLLASSVPGAKLLLFDDAGHAVLFQDAPRFIRAVETFMG